MPERHREIIHPFAGLVRFQSLLTDASVHDDERVGQGYDELKKRGFFWVAVRVKAAFQRTLTADRPVTIETWANPPGAATIDRCYRLTDESGVFAEGVAKWALVRLSDGRPVRLSDVPWLIAPRTFEAETPFPDGFALIEAFTDDVHVLCPVPPSGIDKNGHLNNARYWDLVFAGARATGLRTGDVRTIEIGYQKALFAGESVDLHYRTSKDTVHFCGYVTKDGVTARAFYGNYVL
ncbi:MAG: thioesterase [Bacillota bacterium]|nr:thioesterase [Bacillota bacterium]